MIARPTQSILLSRRLDKRTILIASLVLPWAVALALAPVWPRVAAEVRDTVLLMSNLRRQVSPGSYFWPSDRYTNTGGEIGNRRGD